MTCDFCTDFKQRMRTSTDIACNLHFKTQDTHVALCQISQVSLQYAVPACRSDVCVHFQLTLRTDLSLCLSISRAVPVGLKMLGHCIRVVLTCRFLKNVTQGNIPVVSSGFEDVCIKYSGSDVG